MGCADFMDSTTCPIELCELEWMKDDYYPEFPRRNFMNLVVEAINSNPLYNKNKDLIRKLFSSTKGELWTFMLEKMDKVAQENPDLVKISCEMKDEDKLTERGPKRWAMWCHKKKARGRSGSKKEILRKIKQMVGDLSSGTDSSVERKNKSQERRNEYDAMFNEFKTMFPQFHELRIHMMLKPLYMKKKT